MILPYSTSHHCWHIHHCVYVKSTKVKGHDATTGTVIRQAMKHRPHFRKQLKLGGEDRYWSKLWQNHSNIQLLYWPHLLQCWFQPPVWTTMCSAVTTISCRSKTFSSNFSTVSNVCNIVRESVNWEFMYLRLSTFSFVFILRKPWCVVNRHCACDPTKMSLGSGKMWCQRRLDTRHHASSIVIKITWIHLKYMQRVYNTTNLWVVGTWM